MDHDEEPAMREPHQQVAIELRRPAREDAPKSKVTLVRPPVVVLPGALATHGPTPPLGAAYVAAALRDAGHQVDLIDGAGEAIGNWVEVDSPVGVLHRIGLSPEDIVDRIDPESDIVGITTMFLHEWPQVRELSALIKQRLPDTFLILGGENATAFSRWILAQSDDIDCCVLGEGEATAVELAGRIAEGKPLHGMTGVALHSSVAGEVLDTGLSTRISKAELKSTPRPAWDLVPLDKYFAHYPFFGVNRGRSMQVLGTRGCPYKCSFCSSPQMWTTKYVVREPEDVVDEIAQYVDVYGIENVNFVDLTAATNRKWTLGLCDALEARLPDIEWQLPVGTRIEAIDREVLQRIYDTGCRNITFAPESGSQRMLEIMDKRVKLDKVLAAVEDGNDIGLRTMINIIIGHPDETWADQRKSVRFMWKSAWKGCQDCAVMMFCPYPGSADFEDLVQSGKHEIDESAYYVGLSRGSSSHQSWNDSMSAKQLRWMQLFMIASFYVVSWIRRPKRAWDFFKAQITGREDTYLDQMVRTKRKNLQTVETDVEAVELPKLRRDEGARIGPTPDVAPLPRPERAEAAVAALAERR
jgi:anaerobic magnesium-protoporphyrin IX monomethyl ester cyclase